MSGLLTYEDVADTFLLDCLASRFKWHKPQPGGAIYFVYAPEVDRMKIGYTQSVRSRFKGLQSASPVKLVLVAVAHGTRADEANLHKEFDEYRTHGEWYQLQDAMRSKALQARCEFLGVQIPGAAREVMPWEALLGKRR